MSGFSAFTQRVWEPLTAEFRINQGADADGLDVEKMKGKKFGDLVADEFSSLIGLAEQENAFTLNPDAVIYVNEVFEKLKAVGKSLGDIANDTTDYRARLRETKDDAEKEHCVRMVALKRLGITANKNLDDAFKAIFQ